MTEHTLYKPLTQVTVLWPVRGLAQRSQARNRMALPPQSRDCLCKPWVPPPGQGRLQTHEARGVGPGQAVPMASAPLKVAGSSRMRTMWVATSARVIRPFIGRCSAVSCAM